MKYKVKITRRASDSDFPPYFSDEKALDRNGYYGTVFGLNKRGIIFGHPVFEPKYATTVIENCDPEKFEEFKKAFQIWGDITSEQTKE